MLLINYEIIIILTWSKTCVIASNTDANQTTTFAITDTKLYVPFLILSTQVNAKLFTKIKIKFQKSNTSAKPIFRLLN